MKFKIKPLRWDPLKSMMMVDPPEWVATPIAGPSYRVTYFPHTKMAEAHAYSNGVSLKLGEWQAGGPWNPNVEPAMNACNDHWRAHATWIVESIAEVGE